MTVTPSLELRVSRRIREEFENGRDYYALAGSRSGCRCRRLRRRRPSTSSGTATRSSVGSFAPADLPRTATSLSGSLCLGRSAQAAMTDASRLTRAKQACRTHWCQRSRLHGASRTTPAAGVRWPPPVQSCQLRRDGLSRGEDGALTPAAASARPSSCNRSRPPASLCRPPPGRGWAPRRNRCLRRVGTHRARSRSA